MIIKKFDIEGFGKFSGRTIDFKPGFNLIFGKNEDGKSTLMSFIKLMFYGGGGAKGSDISKNPRRKYAPWNGSAMSGAIEFESSGTEIRLHKEFKKTAATDKTTVYNIGTGEKLSYPASSEMGRIFFDMEQGEFERSVFIDSFGGFSTDASGDSLAMRISNLSVSGDENISQSTIRARIDSAQEELVSKSGKKGLLVNAQSQLEQLKNSLEQLIAQTENQHTLMTDINNIKNEITELETTIEMADNLSKVSSSKKAFGGYTTLLEKLSDRESALEKLKEYKLSLDLLKDLLQKGKELKAKMSAEYAQSATTVSAVISDNEYGRLWDIQKRLEMLDTDEQHIKSSVTRAKETLDTRILSEKKKCKTIALSVGTISIIAGLTTIITMPSLFYIGIAVVLIGSFISFLMFNTFAKNVSARISVQLARQELENSLRMLSFYYEGISGKTLDELLAELGERRTEYETDISNKLKYYECNTLDELGEKTVGAQNSRFASATAEINLQKNKFTELISQACLVNAFEDANAVFNEISDTVSAIDALDREISILGDALGDTKTDIESVQNKITELDALIKNTPVNDNVQTDITDAKSKLAQKRNTLGELQSQISIPEISEHELNVQIEECTETVNAYSERYKILNIVSAAMDAASTEMNKGLGSHLSQKTGEYLKMMSGGKYSDVLVSRDLSVEARTSLQEGFHQWKYLSAGAIDRVYLALRLAATDIIAQKHNPVPLFLDDILTQYDDENCRNTMEFLKEYLENSGSVSQIFFFTCHNHIADIAKEIIPDLNEIIL